MPKGTMGLMDQVGFVKVLIMKSSCTARSHRFYRHSSLLKFQVWWTLSQAPINIRDHRHQHLTRPLITHLRSQKAINRWQISIIIRTLLINQIRQSHTSRRRRRNRIRMLMSIDWGISSPSAKAKIILVSTETSREMTPHKLAAAEVW